MKILLDARQLQGEQLHPYLKEVFAFPSYYGNNFDAFYDCLTDLPETQVQFTHIEQAGEKFAMVRRVLMDATRENPNLTMIE